MSNPFVAIGHWFVGFWKGMSGQLKVSITTFLHDFIHDDLGKLAVDAVNYAETLQVGGVEARDAAGKKFLDDAKAAGHDVASFAESTVNWFIETALQAVRSAATKAPTA